MYIKDFANLNTRELKNVGIKYYAIKYNEELLMYTYTFIEDKFYIINEDIMDIELINKYVFIFINKLYKERISELLILYKLKGMI